MWRDKLYADTTLPFGLRSAPKLFNAVADALQWIMEYNGVLELVHYLVCPLMDFQIGLKCCVGAELLCTFSSEPYR